MTARNPFLAAPAVASDAVPALVPASDPADVPLVSGATSSSASVRVFSAPSGGSGSATLAVVASTGTLAGDNSTGWYVTGLSDGDVSTITGTWTDATTGQTVSNVFVVSVGQDVKTVQTHTLDFVALRTAEGSDVDLVTLGTGTHTVGGRDLQVQLYGGLVSAIIGTTGLRLLQKTTGTTESVCRFSVCDTTELVALHGIYPIITADVHIAARERRVSLGTSSGMAGGGIADESSWTSTPPTSYMVGGVYQNGPTSDDTPAILAGTAERAAGTTVSGLTTGQTYADEYVRIVVSGNQYRAYYKTGSAFPATPAVPASYTYRSASTYADTYAAGDPGENRWAGALRAAVSMYAAQNAALDVTIASVTLRLHPRPI